MFTLGSQGKTIQLGADASPGGSQTPVSTGVARISSGPDYFLFMLVGINVVAVIATLGLFLHVNSLNNKLTFLKGQLANNAATIAATTPPDELQRMLRDSAKVQSIATLFSSRPYTSGLFTLVERFVDDATLFQTMSAVLDPKTKRYTVSLEGEARGYIGVINQLGIMQSQQFAKYMTGVKLDKDYKLNKSTGRVAYKVGYNAALSGVKSADLANNLPTQRTSLSGLGPAGVQTTNPSQTSPVDEDLFGGFIFENEI